ncbi:MAG: hypothetical protein QOI29_4788, partial [Mycobacterium sp.]|nr:hypothetical protein [Mycobacterium sp.]
MALRSRPAVGGFKPPHAALAEDRRGERCGKGVRDASGGDRKDGAQSSISGIAADVSLLNKVASKPGCSRSARDEPGGRTADWPGGVRHVGDVSPVCCSCTERGKACPDTAVRIVADGEREPAKRLTREAVSTVAGRAGGPARSSGEASAGRGGGGAKGPGHPWCVRLINRERASGRSRVDRLKPSGCACVRGSGGQDDRSPVTRDCHAGICGSRRVRPPPATRRVPRTWKGVLFVGRAFGHGAVQEMKVWPFAVALAEGGCKPPHAALAEDRRGERCGKGARDASGGDREDGAQSSFSGIA